MNTWIQSENMILLLIFLPMIKQKIENPKEELEKELKSQKSKFDRIREAYINEVFTLNEYNE